MGLLSEFNKPVVPQRVTKVTTPEQKAEADRRAAAKKAEEEKKLKGKAPQPYYKTQEFFAKNSVKDGVSITTPDGDVVKRTGNTFQFVKKLTPDEIEANKSIGLVGESLKVLANTDNYNKFLKGEKPELQKQVDIIRNPKNAEQLNKILQDPKSEYLGDIISSKSRDALLSSDLFNNASPEALQAGTANLGNTYKSRVFEKAADGGVAYYAPDGAFIGWKQPPPQKKRGGIGGFIGDVVGAFDGVLSNPFVQLGVTALGGGAAVAGYNAGKSIGSGDIKGAVKNFAIGQAAGAAANLAGNAVGSLTGNSIVDSVIKNGIGGAAAGGVGALLNGGDLGDSILKGVIGGSIGSLANQAASGLVNQFKPIDPRQDVATPDYDTQDIPDVVGGGGGGTKNLPVFNLPLDTLTGGTGNVGISDKYFKPNIEPDISNLGGTFQSNVGLNTPTTPLLGGNGDGTGLVAPIYNPNGTTQGFQGSGGATTPDFQIAIGNSNSFTNNPILTGTPMTSGGSVANPPSNTSGGLAGAAGGSLADIGDVSNLGSTQSGQPIGSQQPTAGTTSAPTAEANTKGIESVISDLFKQVLTGLVGGGAASNPFTQSPTQGGTGTNNMAADYSGLLGNILGQNQQINRIQDLAGQQEGKFNAVASQVENKPFTPYNVTSSAGSTMVNGQNITNTLGANQQQLANVAGQAAGMFGDVNVPNANNIRDTALQGSQNLLQQAQGFNPMSAAQTEYDALQQLYKPQRERDQLALENRLRAQGRLGASDNPALRQLFEAQGQQDLQAAINSRNLGFDRQQQLQTLSQGMFTQGSQAAKLPTDIQALRAQIGTAGANVSQLPFNTLNQQQQLANQLAATQATQGTALATKGSDIRQLGIQGNAGLMSQAAQMQNNRDLAAIQGLLGGGQGGNNPISTAINGAVSAGGNALQGLLSQGASAIGNYFNYGNNASPAMPVSAGGGGLNNPQSYTGLPAVFSLPAEYIQNMSDDDFINALLSGE